MSAELQPDFKDLQPYVETWGLPSLQERIARRAGATIEELQEFYATVMPRLDQIIEFLNQFPANAIPDEHKPLASMALSLVQVDSAVNKFNAPVLDRALDPRAFTIKTSFYDTKTTEPG